MDWLLWVVLGLFGTVLALPDAIHRWRMDRQTGRRARR